MPGGYAVPANAVDVTLEIRKSRFIAHAIPVRDRAQALARLAEIRERNPDARHYCWAYVLGDPGGSCDAATNDDGEPSGTAGKPILNVLRHKGVGDVMVVVVRYFGGIKLGAGGLTRAYSAAAEAVMANLLCKQNEPLVTVTLRFDFSREQQVRHWAERHAAVAGPASYDTEVKLRLQLPRRLLGELEEFCRLDAITAELPEETETGVLPPS